MSDATKQPLFVDTGAFYARLDEDDENHERAVEMFERIRSGAVVYEPVYTSQAVLSELATLVLYRLGHERAVRVLDAIDDATTFNVLAAGRVVFAAAREQSGSTTIRRSRSSTTPRACLQTGTESTTCLGSTVTSRRSGSR